MAVINDGLTVARMNHGDKVVQGVGGLVRIESEEASERFVPFKFVRLDIPPEGTCSGGFQGGAEPFLAATQGVFSFGKFLTGHFRSIRR